MNHITDTLVDWHASHGRHDLPWQNTRDAYRIWLSEIMLQQTQVTTVIPYYERFLQRFPNVTALAEAATDEVLHLWTGLGYYARARNLHKTAQIVTQQYNGKFPTDIDDVIALPGIGKSTAGAILAFSEHQPHAILDGNVKRVLARFYAVEGWYGNKAVEKQLWQLAQANTPSSNVHIYTQAIMDFGATLCSRSKPNCAACPLQTNCKAFAQSRVTELPHGKPKTTKPTKQTVMLLIKNSDDEFLLQQNPPSGIWGGLWCPPQVNEAQTEHHIGNVTATPLETLPMLKHTFSHYTLEITPVLCRAEHRANIVAENTHIWYKPESNQALGLAAPVKKLLHTY
ncbi:A/G-specific adenine glycosylase [Arenicella xantha]|uniref:Adenine DNA glycosylase n=1 Tax=Arenicella xantha TaxID=644221 RepID=A0A395JQ82_9GAMM|nr:A/G-specific adenine glycosylase [Arenicella xantha]RBP53503.1 A/G-specific DNA-adenine glycosylase [Arenicella xantha]